MNRILQVNYILIAERLIRGQRAWIRSRLLLRWLWARAERDSSLLWLRARAFGLSRFLLLETLSFASAVVWVGLARAVILFWLGFGRADRRVDGQGAWVGSHAWLGWWACADGYLLRWWALDLCWWLWWWTCAFDFHWLR